MRSGGLDMLARPTLLSPFTRVFYPSTASNLKRSIGFEVNSELRYHFQMEHDEASRWLPFLKHMAAVSLLLMPPVRVDTLARSLMLLPVTMTWVSS